jgi:hypothetical protein
MAPNGGIERAVDFAHPAETDHRQDLRTGRAACPEARPWWVPIIRLLGSGPTQSDITRVERRPVLPRSRHLPVASTDGSRTEKLNKLGCGCGPIPAQGGDWTRSASETGRRDGRERREILAMGKAHGRRIGKHVTTTQDQSLVPRPTLNLFAQLGPVRRALRHVGSTASHTVPATSPCGMAYWGMLTHSGGFGVGTGGRPAVTSQWLNQEFAGVPTNSSRRRYTGSSSACATDTNR